MSLLSSASRPPVRRAVGVVVAVAGTVATYVVDPAPLLAALVGLSFGLGAWLTLRNHAVAPALAAAGWPHRRWNALMVGFTTAAAVVGVQPLFDSIRGLTLPMLVLGVGFVAVQCGVASVLDAGSGDAEGAGEATPSTP